MSSLPSTEATAPPPHSLPFPDHALASVSLPSTPLVRAAWSYINTHTSPSVRNHTVRSAYFALLLVLKIPALSTVDAETLVLATLLHDLGWSRTRALVSVDRRFEVDGADAAREFVRVEIEREKEKEMESREIMEGWDEARIDGIWYAIALHTTPSISMYAPPLTFATRMGIKADFMGPNLPSPNTAVGGTAPLITPEDFAEVIRAYPRLGFKEEVKEIMCRLCVDKPETTFDTFVEAYGRRFVEGYEEKWAGQPSSVDSLESELDATVEFE